MRKFQFKFQAVLQDRKRREEESLLSLANAQKKYQAELKRKSDLTSELNQSRERLQILTSNAVRIQAIWAEQDFISGTKQRIIQADQAILRTYRFVEKEMRAYLVCRRRSRAMEVLHDKALAEYKRDAVKREAKELDDLNTMRFSHMNEELKI